MLFRYFQIDGNDCASPTLIKGMNYFPTANSLHYPMQGKAIALKQIFWLLL